MMSFDPHQRIILPVRWKEHALVDVLNFLHRLFERSTRTHCQSNAQKVTSVAIYFKKNEHDAWVPDSIIDSYSN